MCKPETFTSIEITGMPKFLKYLMLLCVITLLGCDQWQSTTENELVKELPDLPSMVPASSAKNSDSDSAAIRSEFAAFKMGQQFTYEKSITHTLTQATGDPSNKSVVQIDLVFTLWVEEIQQDRTRFGLRFQQVKYSQNIAGEKIEYDSEARPETIPAAVQAVHDLTQQKLSIWRDAQGVISQLSGWPKQDSAIRTVSHSQAAEVPTISDLLDPAFDLLAEARTRDKLAEGQSWITQQQFAGTVSLIEKLNCFCKSKNSQSVDVDVTGTITPGLNLEDHQFANSSPVKVSSGHTIGKVRYDVNTGLPEHSTWQRYILMQVNLESGEKFEQRKDTRTALKLRESPTANTVAPSTPPIK